jgi:hypothetical protein
MVRSFRFDLDQLDEQLAAFASRWPGATADAAGLAFVAAGARLRLPLRAPRLFANESIGSYCARRPGPPERALLLLLQAGAMAFGCWDGDELMLHKATRRYVVRGHGKAQPLHARTRGKSRYGARLRLQNWRRLLVETNQRLRAAFGLHGAPERLFVAAPVRAFGALFGLDPPPPFAADEPTLQRVPMHVHRPDFAELQRVWSWLGRGRLELPDAAAP